MSLFPGRVLLTGATGQIGTAILTALRAADTPVLAVSRREGQSSAGVEWLPADLTEERDLDRVSARAAGPDIDAVVNVAGVTGPRVPVWEATTEQWASMSLINVRPVIAVCQAAVRGWIARDWPGAIVNMSSPGAVRAHRHRSVYDASRAAVEAYTRGIAVDAGPHGIRANSIRPAAVGLPAPESPLGRGATPAEVAMTVLTLLQSTGITGTAVDIDGGLLAQLRAATDDQRHEAR